MAEFTVECRRCGRTMQLIGPIEINYIDECAMCERAGCFDCCGGSDEHPPEHTQDCSARQESERVCADCGLPVSHRVHRGFGPCGGQSTKTIHPEFARGMRRAVEIAEGRAKATWLFRDVVSTFVSELKDAIEKDLK